MQRAANSETYECRVLKIFNILKKLLHKKLLSCVHTQNTKKMYESIPKYNYTNNTNLQIVDDSEVSLNKGWTNGFPKSYAAYMICMHVQPQLWDTCNICSWKCILYNQIKKATQIKIANQRLIIEDK